MFVSKSTHLMRFHVRYRLSHILVYLFYLCPSPSVFDFETYVLAWAKAK